jgi:hypothetical protein
MNPNKTPFHLVGLDFVAAIAEVFAGGLKNGREPFDWQEREWTKEEHDEYCDALLRHVQRAIQTRTKAESLKHWAAVAANAYILWWHNRSLVELAKLGGKT